MSSQPYLVSHLLVDGLHSDWLRRLRYYHSNDMLMSCSGNSRDSLIMRGIMKNAHDKVYIYKVLKVKLLTLHNLKIAVIQQHVPPLYDQSVMFFVSSGYRLF